MNVLQIIPIYVCTVTFPKIYCSLHVHVNPIANFFLFFFTHLILFVLVVYSTMYIFLNEVSMILEIYMDVHVVRAPFLFSLLSPSGNVMNSLLLSARDSFQSISLYLVYLVAMNSVLHCVGI